MSLNARPSVRASRIVASLALLLAWTGACSGDREEVASNDPGTGGADADSGVSGSGGAGNAGSGGSADAGSAASGGVAGSGATGGGAGSGADSGAAGSAGATPSACGPSSSSCTGFTDPLSGSTIGVATGGQFTSEGWKVTQTGGQHLDWTNCWIGNEGSFEFEVKGMAADQICGGGGKCRLWWFAANDLDPLGALSKWAATGRRIGQNFQCDPCNPLDYIDKTRLGVSWLSAAPIWSATAWQWDAATWYAMKVEWSGQHLEWRRDGVLLSEANGKKSFTPEADGATAMSFMVGGGIFGSKGAIFRNVKYTPTQCASVSPL